MLPELLLAIKTADCVPVLVADVKAARGRRVSCWLARNCRSRSWRKAWAKCAVSLAAYRSDLRAAIGPCIRKCCYSVGAEVRAEFESQFAYADDLFEEVFDSNAIHVAYPLLFLNQRAPGHGDLGPEIHLDLVAANRRQLEMRVCAKSTSRGRWLHGLRHQSLLLASRGVWQRRAE